MPNTPEIRGVKCKKDSKFEGSIYDKMGLYLPWKCPHCGTNITKEKICLNGCGLSQGAMQRFNAIFATTRASK